VFESQLGNEKTMAMPERKAGRGGSSVLDVAQQEEKDAGCIEWSVKDFGFLVFFFVSRFSSDFFFLYYLFKIFLVL
jgi:hypothetical protein